MTVTHTAGTDGLQVRLNGAVVDRSQLGKPIPLDGGDQIIEATAANRKPWRAHVVLAARADAKTIVIPALESADPQPLHAAEAAAPSVAARGAGASESAARIPREAAESSRISAEEWVGLGTIGLGIVGLGIGAVFAVQAASESEAPNQSCDGAVCTYRAGGDDARDVALLSLVAGGVLAASGLVIYLSTGSSSSSDSATAHGPSLASAPWVGPDGAGAALHGRF